jgi:hypothetical protein
MGLFEKLMKRMAEYYAKESGGISWKWQAMDSKNSPAPLAATTYTRLAPATFCVRLRLFVGELKKSQNHPFSQAVETLDSAARRTFGGSAFNSSSIASSITFTVSFSMVSASPSLHSTSSSS